MLITPRAIEKVADRIERAYARRNPQGIACPPDARLWELAARALVEAHRASEWLPLDPELFVASQPANSPLADPWQHLSPSQAVRHYRRRILQIVRGLRLELRQEVQRAEARLQQGHPLKSVLRGRDRSLSPLGRFVVAYRAGRSDLAEKFREDATEQHASCPLYRLACRRLIPAHAYPVLELLPGLIPTRRIGPPASAISMN